MSIDVVRPSARNIHRQIGVGIWGMPISHPHDFDDTNTGERFGGGHGLVMHPSVDFSDIDHSGESGRH